MRAAPSARARPDNCASGRPQAAAIPMTCRNSRRFTRRRASLVDRRVRVEQQRNQVFDLLFGERSGMAEAGHVRTQVECLGVVDFAVHVLLHLRAVAAGLAELAQAVPNVAEGSLVRPDLVAVVATAAIVTGAAVVPGHAAPVLRDAI